MPTQLLEPEPAELEPEDERTVTADGAVEMPWGDSPVVIREKLHRAQPMTLDDALYEMEMVGHDFFLFVDAETSLPSVAYRTAWLELRGDPARRAGHRARRGGLRPARRRRVSPVRSRMGRWSSRS